MTATEILTRFRIQKQDGSAGIVRARGEARALALLLEFAPARVQVATTIVAELGRNILMYAGEGEIRLGMYGTDQRNGLSITAHDEGPGIANLERALMCGYSTSGSPGCGLPGISRMADEFSIASNPGTGTTVRVILWEKKSGGPPHPI